MTDCPTCSLSELRRNLLNRFATISLMLAGFSVFVLACGTDSVCPNGTEGKPCAPTSAIGPQPELPAAAGGVLDVLTDSSVPPDTSDAVDASESSDLDARADGGVGDAEFSDIPTDTQRDGQAADGVEPDAGNGGDESSADRPAVAAYARGRCAQVPGDAQASRYGPVTARHAAFQQQQRAGSARVA
ncbi:MAG: hypothetical protein R3F39_19650 [Myxococcota bacterium]